MQKFTARHGDLYLESINEIPEGVVQRKTGIILEGTATGHSHVLNGGLVFEKDDAIYLQAGDSATVTHEEHNLINLPEGRYSVTRQREYDPYAQVIRNVLD
jgi:hypothetical protein